MLNSLRSCKSCSLCLLSQSSKDVRMQKSFTIENKVEAVQWHRKTGSNMSKATCQFGVDCKRMRHWNSTYETMLQLCHGKGKFKRSMDNARPIFSESFTRLYTESQLTPSFHPVCSRFQVGYISGYYCMQKLKCRNEGYSASAALAKTSMTNHVNKQCPRKWTR